jgi:glycosyltransferase involved in cell wall biosynthesis
LFLDWDIVTPHFPPQEGGIADYTFAVAKALLIAGDVVSVWCPHAAGEKPEIQGAHVHQVFQTFAASDLHRLDRTWNAAHRQPRRILLMYHPHGFGWHSLNVPFCLWLWKRAALNGDRIVIVLHEYAVDFKPWKFYLFAAVHRLMLAVVLRGAAQVWSPVAGWINAASILALGRRVPIEWLPVFSNIPLAGDEEQVVAVRSGLTRQGELLIGHFGTCPKSVTCLLDRILPPLLRSRKHCKALLMGEGTDQYASTLAKAHPDLSGRIRGLGPTSAASISIYLRACDVLLQPYVDGVSARRTSAMAGLENGVPLITTQGALTEPFWKQIHGARLAAVGNLEQMIHMTEELLDQPDVRASMSVAARQNYADHFSLERVVQRLRACEKAFENSKENGKPAA